MLFTCGLFFLSRVYLLKSNGKQKERLPQRKKVLDKNEYNQQEKTRGGVATSGDDRPNSFVFLENKVTNPC